MGAKKGKTYRFPFFLFINLLSHNKSLACKKKIKNAVCVFKNHLYIDRYASADVDPILKYLGNRIIHGINKSEATLQELVEYIAHQRRQQQYNDYKGVAITPEHITALKAMIRP